MIRVGRATLRTPMDAPYRPRQNSVVDGTNALGRPNPARIGTGVEAWHLVGRQTGAAAHAEVEVMRVERGRDGSVYVVDDSPNPVLLEGYYAVEHYHYDVPRGSPGVRPWNLELVSTPHPRVLRQAEDDADAGTVESDATAEEGERVTYTPTTSEVIVLSPRLVVDTEAFNLPAGTYRALLRVRQAGFDSALLRVRLVEDDGTVIDAGAQVAVDAADEWVELDMGVLESVGGESWYDVSVEGVTAELGDVWLDCILWEPVDP